MRPDRRRYGRGVQHALKTVRKSRVGRRRGNWRQAVVTRRRPTTLLDPIEESLDPVAGAVEIRAEADRIAAIAFWRDVGPCALLHGKLSDPVGVIATVGK